MRAALIVLLAGMYGIASAQQQNPPSNIVEQRLMQNLACTCPTCNLEAIERCQCEQATKMRAEVKEALHGVDISTGDKRETAYQRVRSLFAAKYGPDVLTPNEKKTDPRMNWLPIVMLVGGALSLVIITRRSIKRRRASQR
jgi:cytochrome c-type biogenesis protein CcmH/NrfF